jgi:hypothetical protein
VQGQAQPKFTIDLSKNGIKVSPTQSGLFFEDINHAADGGLYAELIRNRSFEDATTLDYWTVITQTGAIATATVETQNLLNVSQSQALKLKVDNATLTARAGISNTGFWGINVVNGQQYKLSFFAKCDSSFTGTVRSLLREIIQTQSLYCQQPPKVHCGLMLFLYFHLHTITVKTVYVLIWLRCWPI